MASTASKPAAAAAVAAAATTEASSERLPPTTPILILHKVIIRPYHISDAPFSSHNANDPGISLWMRNTFPHPYELHNAEYFINNIATKETRRPPSQDSSSSSSSSSSSADLGIFLHYALCRRSDGAFVGGIGLKPLADVEARTMEIGYWVGREHWGKGYVTDSVTGFARWAFQTFPELLRLEASFFEGNTASERVLKKAGFTAEGVRRKAVWKAGRSLDMIFYGMLREECT